MELKIWKKKDDKNRQPGEHSEHQTQASGERNTPLTISRRSKRSASLRRFQKKEREEISTIAKEKMPSSISTGNIHKGKKSGGKLGMRKKKDYSPYSKLKGLLNFSVDPLLLGKREFDDIKQSSPSNGKSENCRGLMISPAQRKGTTKKKGREERRCCEKLKTPLEGSQSRKVREQKFGMRQQNNGGIRKIGRHDGWARSEKI